MKQAKSGRRPLSQFPGGDETEELKVHRDFDTDNFRSPVKADSDYRYLERGDYNFSPTKSELMRKPLRDRYKSTSTLLELIDAIKKDSPLNNQIHLKRNLPLTLNSGKAPISNHIDLISV